MKNRGGRSRAAVLHVERLDHQWMTRRFDSGFAESFRYDALVCLRNKKARSRHKFTVPVLCRDDANVL